MPKSFPAGDVSICTVLSLHDSGVVTLISSSDDSLSTVDEAGRAVVCDASTVVDDEVCCVLTSTEGTMSKSKTASDAFTCTVLSLEESGNVTFISSSDDSLSAVDESGRTVVCDTSIVMKVELYCVVASTEVEAGRAVVCAISTVDLLPTSLGSLKTGIAVLCCESSVVADA
eukprot:3144156-Ditylum_brightwellii.AAC.1